MNKGLSALHAKHFLSPLFFSQKCFDELEAHSFCGLNIPLLYTTKDRLFIHNEQFKEY